MQARVIEIESGSEYRDGERRLTLKFLDDEGAILDGSIRNRVTLRENAVGVGGLGLDSVVTVKFVHEERR